MRRRCHFRETHSPRNTKERGWEMRPTVSEHSPRWMESWSSLDRKTDLSSIAGSLVIARSTAFGYKGKAVDVRQIGCDARRPLRARRQRRRSGSRVCINVQRIDTETGGHVRAERFAVSRQHLAETEDEIVGRLACSLTANWFTLWAVGSRACRGRPRIRNGLSVPRSATGGSVATIGGHQREARIRLGSTGPYGGCRML